MKRYIGLFILTFNCFSIIGFGQVLYQLDHPDQNERLFLLGTFHDIPRNIDFQIDPRIDSLIEISDVIFSEYFGDNGYSNYLTQLTELSGISATSNVKSTFRRKERKMLFEFFQKEYRVSPKLLRKYQEFNPYFFHRGIFNSAFRQFSMDSELFKIAKIKQSKIIVLDTFEILKMASGVLNKAFDKTWLLGIPNGSTGHQENFENLFSAYLSQDTSEIWKFNQENIRWYKDDFEWLIGGRNEEWLKTYERDKGTVNFMFAGMAHLVAPKMGLLDTFKEKGYQITPLPIQTIF